MDNFSITAHLKVDSLYTATICQQLEFPIYYKKKKKELVILCNHLKLHLMLCKLVPVITHVIVAISHYHTSLSFLILWKFIVQKKCSFSYYRET